MRDEPTVKVITKQVVKDLSEYVTKPVGKVIAGAAGVVMLGLIFKLFSLLGLFSIFRRKQNKQLSEKELRKLEAAVEMSPAAIGKETAFH